MQFLNRDFYNCSHIIPYINASVQVLINTNATILSTKEYMLFFYIKEDFSANLYALYNTDIDLDCLGFSVLQRNTRHSIESFLDLVNLSHDADYLSVMEHCADRNKPYNSKYHSILKGTCTIPQKYKIATQMYKERIPKNLLNISSKTNSYTHPNVFIDILNITDYNKKTKILKDLLKTNLYTLTEAYKILLKSFNNGTIPILNCINCPSQPYLKNCNQCFANEKTRFENLIENSLVTYTNPFPIPYY